MPAESDTEEQTSAVEISEQSEPEKRKNPDEVEDENDDVIVGPMPTETELPKAKRQKSRNCPFKL